MKSRIRSLATDTLIYGVFTIVGRFLTFMLTPLYSNYLTKSEFGDISYIFAILAFLNIIYSFGMESSFLRFYKKDDHEHNKLVFSHSYLFILCIGIVITATNMIVATYLAPSLTDATNGVSLLRFAAILPLTEGLMTVPYALLRMKRKAFKFAMTRLSIIIIGVTLNIVFVVMLRWHSVGVVLAQLIANSIGVLMFGYELVKYMKFKFDPKLFLQMLKFGVPTLPANLSAIVLQIADRPIMRMLTNSAEVGMYSMNYRLGMPMMLIVSVFEYAWKPFYLSRYEDEDAKNLFSRILTYFTLVAAGVFLIVGFFISYVVKVPFVGGKFINPVYWSGMGIIPIILCSYYFNGVFTNLAAGFYINKKTQYLPLIVGVGAVINIIINFITIPVYGYWAAAWATFIAYFVTAVVAYYYSMKIYPIKYEWKRIMTIIIPTAIIYVLCNYLTIHLTVWLSLGIRSGGIIIFILLIWRLNFFTPGELKSLRRMFNPGNSG